MGALGAFTGRLMLASLFLLSGAMKLVHHDGAGGPIVAYMASARALGSWGGGSAEAEAAAGLGLSVSPAGSRAARAAAPCAQAPKLDATLDGLHAATGLRLPLDKEVYPTLAFAAGCLELLGGVLFVAGTSLGAWLLMLFLVPTTLVMHAFWQLDEGTPAHQIEFVNFMKNVCLFGAFLLYVSQPRQLLVGSGARGAKAKYT